MSPSMVEPVIAEVSAGAASSGLAEGVTMRPRPDSLVQSYVRSADKTTTLLLDQDAWTLITPGGLSREPLDASPALHLSRLDVGRLARGARVRVVIADFWLRHLVIEWPKGVSSQAECAAYLGLRFREVHGVSAPEWQFALDRDSVAPRVLACAVPAALVSAVQVWVRQHPIHLVGLSSDFVTQYNEFLPRFREPKGALGALAVVRGTRLMLGLWRDAQWLAVRSLPTSEEEVGATVARALEAWSLAHPHPDAGKRPPVGVLYGVGTVGLSGVEAALPSAWKIERCGGAA